MGVHTQKKKGGQFNAFGRGGIIYLSQEGMRPSLRDDAQSDLPTSLRLDASPYTQAQTLKSNLNQCLLEGMSFCSTYPNDSRIPPESNHTVAHHLESSCDNESNEHGDA